MTTIAHSSTPGNPGSIVVRTQAESSDPSPFPPLRRPLWEIDADPRLSNGAKRLARYLDGLCLAFGKWAAWPKVSTIADALGWKGDPRAFRKRVERAFRELVARGDVARPRLGELVAWHEADGARSGLGWPKGLRRNLCRSAAICVLGWKLAEAERAAGTIPPSLTACDIPVASTERRAADLTPSNVACHPPKMSHAPTPKMSHPQNVRTSNVAIEPTLNVAAHAPGGGEPPAAVEPARSLQEAPAAVEATAIPSEPPAAVEPARSLQEAPAAVEATAAPLWTPRELAEKFVTRLRNRGIFPEVRIGEAGAEIIHIPFAGMAKLDPADVAELKSPLRPHVIAYLTGRVESPESPTAGPPAPVPETRPAPKVRESHRVRDLIGRLAGNPDREAEVMAARALADALGDHKPESHATFLGLAGSVRRGELAEAIVQDAFEAACGKTARNRGAVFIARVKSGIASARPSTGSLP